MKSDVLSLLREAKKRVPTSLLPAASRVRRTVMPYLAEAVYREREVARCFQPPTLSGGTHFLVSLESARRESTDEAEDVKVAVEQCESSLLKVASRYLRENPSHATDGVVAALKHWEMSFRDQGALSSADGVEKFLWLLGELRGGPWVDWLSEHAPDALRAWLEMPEGVVRARRLELFMSPSECSALLASLMGETVGRPKWGGAITELELPVVSPYEDEVPEQPCCTIHLAADFARQEPEAYRALKHWIAARLSRVEVPPDGSLELADYFHEAGTEWEGKGGYKRYLAALCRLDAVY